MPVTQPEVNDAVCLLPNQPVAVIWDSKRKKKWYVGFFLDINKDGTYRIDHLERKGYTDKLWCRPSVCDDIQDTEEVQILPVNVVGHWDSKEEKPTFIITNITKIKESLNYVCQLFDVWCFTWRFVLSWLVELKKPIHEA